MKKSRSGYYSMAAIRYAKVLYELQIPGETIENVKQIFEEVPGMQEVLDSPVIEAGKKHTIIDRSFPKESRNFLKVVSDHGKAGILPEMFEAYEDRKNEMAGIVTAHLSYVTAPSREQLEKLEDFVSEKYHASGVRWEMQECPDLIGGFVLYVNGREYDYSMQGRLKRLEQKLTRR